MSSPRYQATRQIIASLDCVVVLPETEAKPAALAVLCHGYGAGGDDLVGLAGELLHLADLEQPIAMVFPAAPLSLAEQGMPGGRAWWNLSIQRLISAFEDGRFEQVREEVPEGIDDARQALVDTIQECFATFSLDESQLLLGGFSQGAMLSVETACLGLAQPPRQLCLYSGALICEQRWMPAMPRLTNTSIFQSHGSLDQVLPMQAGIWLRDALTEAGCEVDFVEFLGPHTIPMEALEHTALMLSALSRGA